MLTWEFVRAEFDERDGIPPDAPFAIAFEVVPGATASTGIAALVASSPEWDVTASDEVTVRVHESLEPNDTPAEAVPASPDDLFVSTLADARDINLYTVTAEQGERLAVDLSNLDTDYDLVLYGPAAPAVTPTTSTKEEDRPAARAGQDLPISDQGWNPVDRAFAADAQPVDDLPGRRPGRPRHVHTTPR